MEGVIGWFVENIFAVVFSLILTYVIANVAYVVGKSRGKNISVNMRATIDRTEEERQRHAKKGIILLMSRYTSFSGAIKSMEEKEIKKALEQKKYEVFDLENSSLGHGVRSMLTHSAKLRHCWIIGSYAENSSSVISSSINFIETFVEYLKQEKGLEECSFYYGKQYAIPMNDDNLICNRAYELTNDIFTEAKKDYKLTPKDIIVDVTGGTLSMSLGLTLASLHKDRDIQVIGAEYDRDGRAIPDKSYPVRIHFEPKIRS
ncbi:hypothetical protein M1N62_04615 [Thermodesulfovibrionales bacterium]|nr:hypothetical protein [Thermodesulfovibrionales bacterium]